MSGDIIEVREAPAPFSFYVREVEEEPAKCPQCINRDPSAKPNFLPPGKSWCTTCQWARICAWKPSLRPARADDDNEPDKSEVEFSAQYYGILIGSHPRPSECIYKILVGFRPSRIL